MKSFVLELPEENAEIRLLEKLSYEIDGYTNIITHIFSTHQYDTNFLDSQLWNDYYSKYEETVEKYNITKSLFSDFITPLVKETLNTSEDIQFTWNIPDLNKSNVEIYME